MSTPAESNLEVHGEFWLPGADDKKVPGTLTFSAEEGGSLKLIGSFTEWHQFFGKAQAKDYSRILGEDDKTKYTLDGCLRTRERQTLGGGARQSFSVGQVVKDAWFDKDEAIEAEMVDVEIDHLLGWMGISGLSEQGTFSEAAGGAVTEWRIVGVPQQPHVVELPFGKLELRHVVRPPAGDITGLRMGQDVYARFDFGSLHLLSEAIDYASDLQDLVSIATQRSAAFRGVLLHHEALSLQTSSGRTEQWPARLYSAWRVKADSKPARAWEDRLFTFEEFGGIEGVGRWMRVAETYRELLGRMMMTRYAKDSIVQDVVASRIATLEGFDRQRFGGSQTKLLTRLKRLAAHAGAPFEQLVDADNVTAWCTKAKDYRNDIAHHLARYPGVGGAEMHYVGQAAYWLFVLCLLREAEAPAAVYDRLVQSQQFLFEAGEIRSSL
ncbi:HEPN domain-containing protein [Saccharothrix sp. HUAS TT1]|uniref:ApeA N-terminal domain 1-containing protein n=1 Tax=unclassified Saccharothrix TaxID=2593673 RepID=UPI00345C4BAF